MAGRRRARLWERPTSDIIVLALTFTVCFVIVADLVFLIFLSLHQPDKDLGEFSRNVGDIVNVLIGAVVGYLAGNKIPLPKITAPEEKTNDEDPSVGDIHVSDTPPANCTDTYTDDIIEMLRWLADYALTNDFDAVIWSGDVFDKKSPSKNSHSLVLKMLEVVRAHDDRLWIVPGNHDQLHDRLDTLLTHQPLGVLYAAGAHMLDGWHPTLPVYGVPWQQNWGWLDSTFQSWRLDPWRFEDERQYDNRPEGGAPRDRSDCLAVTHASIFPPELVKDVPYDNIPAEDFALTMGNQGYLYYGHIHDYHGIYEVNGVTFANMGAISRGSLTESNKTRAVRACIWETGVGFTELEVPHKPADEVFRLEAAEIRAAKSLDMEEFLRAVGSNTLDMVSVAGTAAYIRDLPNVSPEVKSLAVELLEQADD